MDCSEDLGAEDMITVQQVAPSSILVPVSSESVRVGGAGGGAELGRRLLLAARHGDTQAVLDLMARGAPFTTDWLGTSALHLAAGGAHAQTCAVLLRAGVSRDCRTKVDRTPLHLAAHAGHTNVVSLLLDNNAAVDCRDMLQMTPLHWACVRGHAAAARELLARGADHRALSKFNKTPLQLARTAPHPALADLLEAHEAAALVTTTTHEAESPANRQTTQESPKLTEIKATKQATSQPEPIKISIERNEGGAGAEAAAAMLRRHGITLLPRDEGSTVLSALQSGRSVVLSDAGKLMLKESSALSPAPASAPAPAPPKVVLSARPVHTPPAGAVKIFTLNNKLVTLPKENKAPVKKVIDPFDTSQVQYIKLPSDAKITMLKSKASPARPAPSPSPAIKLTLQKSDNALQTGAGGANSVLYVPEQFMSNSSPKYLRTQLLAAHRTIAQLNAQLAQAKARLALYETV